MQKTEHKPYSYTSVNMVLAIIFVACFWLVVGLIFMLIFASIWQSRDHKVDIIADYILMNIPHLTLLFSAFLASKWILHTPLKMLTTDRPHFSFKLCFISAFVAFFICTIMNAPFIFSGKIHFYSGMWAERLLLLPFILVITPLQTSAEEIFFRVLPARLVYKGKMETEIGPMVLLSLVSGILFTLPHLSSPEMDMGSAVLLIIYYFTFGFLAMYLSLYTRGFECSLALHAAINLFTALILGYEEGTFNTAPLFMIAGIPDAGFDAVILLVIFITTGIFVTLAAKKGLLGDNKVSTQEVKTNG